MRRERLDKLLVDRGLVASRERARRLVMAGAVRAADRIVDKPGTLVQVDALIRVEEPDIPFVSRGGLKLAAALEAFHPKVTQAVVLDVGASTGGFTDCVLQEGARAVVAVDVGYGQFAWSLRCDPRVTLLERTNIRYLAAGELPVIPTLAVIDVSFISLRLVLPKVADLIAPGGEIIAQASADQEQVLIADCDLGRIEEMRKGWPFLRDRRIDAYQAISQRLLD